MMTDQEINRMIAKQAARGVYLYAHHSDIADMHQRLLAEAKDIDSFYCSDEDMVNLADAELRRLRGNARGGIMASIRRKTDSRV